MHRREIAADSGGPGRFRGGCGQYMEVGALTGKPYNLGPIFDRTRIPAEGYAGGGQGARGAITLSDGRELQDKSQVALARGRAVHAATARRRRLLRSLHARCAAVLDDVLDGFVSVAAARTEYGVVINPTTLRVDEEATKSLRSSHSVIEGS